MLLHTVADPEMIFPPKYSDIKYYKLKHGYIGCEKTPQGFMISSINSTNLKDYLSGDLTPGMLIK